jgi:hypothetical protein
MRLLLAFVLALGAVPSLARAQTTTAESITEAIRLYENLQVERSLVMLRSVISPSSPFEVSRDQRVQAYLYIGASLAILGRRDSAVTYFRAAIERDPFADLDPARFTEKERTAFAEARSRTLAVAIRPVGRRRLDPAGDQLPMTVVTSQPAQLRVEVRQAGDTSGVVLFDRESEGVRELAWSTRLPSGGIAPPGRYALFVRGLARSGAVDSAAQLIDLAHDHPALEDTLPPLRPELLLPERVPGSVARGDLARGLGLAAIALAIPVITNPRLSNGGQPLAKVAALGGIAAGVAAFVDRRRHPVDHAAIEANAKRRAARAVYNAEVARRNTERLAATRIVVTPVPGTQ